MTTRTRIAALVAVSALALAGCGGGKPTAVPGGNNAPTRRTSPSRPVYPTSTATATPSTTSTTSTTSPAPSTTSTTALIGSGVTLPGGGQARWGTPQKGRPWTQVGTPEYVAARFMAGYKQVFWDRPVDYWTTAIKPWSTPSWWHTIAAPAVAAYKASGGKPHSAGGAAYLARLRAKQVVDLVNIITSDRVDQAGWTPTSEVVEVFYDFYDTTAANRNPRPGNEAVAYCYMVKVGGRWLVNRETAAANVQPVG